MFVVCTDVLVTGELLLAFVVATGGGSTCSTGAKSGAFCTTGAGFFMTGLGLVFLGGGSFFGGGGTGLGGGATSGFGADIAIIDTSITSGTASVVSSTGCIKHVNSQTCNSVTNIVSNNNILCGRSSPNRAAHNRRPIGSLPYDDSPGNAKLLPVNESIKQLYENG